jgi:hypothetical protein
MSDRAATARSARLAGSDPSIATDAQRTDQRGRLGRAYRAGRLICARVHVTISRDERLGLTQRERRPIRARFHEPLDDELRSELTQLVRRRGAAAWRVAADLDAIELLVDDPGGEPQSIIGHLEPPQVRHGQLRDIEFEFDLRRTR